MAVWGKGLDIVPPNEKWLQTDKETKEQSPTNLNSTLIFISTITKETLQQHTSYYLEQMQNNNNNRKKRQNKQTSKQKTNKQNAVNGPISKPYHQ